MSQDKRLIRNEGKNSEVIQRQNRLLVLRIIREKKVISRVDLAKITGLKQATITNIANELIDSEYIVEAGLIEGKNGRRVNGLKMNLDKMRILVVRATSHYYAVGAYDIEGNCIQIEKIFWNVNESMQEKMNAISMDLQLYLSANSELRILGIGILMSGNLNVSDSDEISCNFSSQMDFFQSYFSEKYAFPVYVKNYSDMSAYFEWERQKSVNKELKTLVSIMISYSVDCAIVSEGRLINDGLNKGKGYGHVSIDIHGERCECGNRGCVNQYVSVGAVKKRVGELKGQYPDSQTQPDWNIRNIINAFLAREPLAVAVFEQEAEYLGIIVTNLINQFNPDEVIIGDEIPNDKPFLEMVRSSVKKYVSEKTFNDVDIRFFTEKRKTENDVGMKGLCLYITNDQLKHMEL